MDYDPQTVESEWEAHVRKCPVCALYVPGKPATLSHICVVGAPLIKGVLELAAKPAVAARRKAEREVERYREDLAGGGRRVTKDHLAKLTRYVGDT